MQALTKIVGLFGITELTIVAVFYFRSMGVYRLFSQDIDTQTKIIWKGSQYAFLVTGLIIGGISIVAAAILYLATNQYRQISFQLLFSASLMGTTGIIAIASYAFMTYKLQLFRMNRNVELAEGVDAGRRKIMGMFVFFLFIQAFFLIADLF
jgi:hypothetical protein